MNTQRERRMTQFAALWFVALAFSVRADIRPGDRYDQVIRELGYGDSSARIGSTEILNYKNGMTVRIENGIVTEIAQRGKVGAARLLNPPEAATQGLNPRRAANDETAIPQPDPARASLPAIAVQPEAPEPQPASDSAEEAAVSEQPSDLAVPTDPAERSAVEAFRANTRGNPAAAIGALAANIPQAAIGALLVIFVVMLLGYAFCCYCYKRICEKAGESPGVLIWIPVAQFIPLLKIAQMPYWMLVLFLIPMVNIVVMLMLWAKICSALNRSPWLAASLLVPVANLFLIPYLAFSASNREPA